MSGTSFSSTFLSRMKRLLPSPLFRLFLRRSGKRSKARSGKGPIAQAVSASPPPSPTNSISFSAVRNDSQSHYDLAQRLQKLSPPDLNWYGSDVVQIVGAAPFASGGSADVWKGSFQDRPVAVKDLRCYSSSEFDPAEIGIRFLKEVWASTNLSHPNVVPILGVYSSPAHPFALVYEMMENVDLRQHLAQQPAISRLKFLAEISRALKHLHGLDITHGNIKLRNLLVDSNHVARLGGFGSAFSLSLPASWSDVESERLFGGIAPELIDPRAFGFVEARHTKATDMFSFGMLAWEVLVGRPPFAGQSDAAVILSVFRNNRPPRPVHPEVTDRVWNMIERCWNKDPFNRMSATEVVDILEAEL